ncbi:hypothetical protein G4228_015445 [Cervus hanglu yarkandensis]|nr:hypothetical protein G4228_015445 [Cervus hanglu yarkandensis]
MPGVGVFQCVSTGMTITGKSFMGGNMEIIVVLNITATNRLLQDEETGLPMFKSEGCEVILVSVKTNLPSNMLPKVVNKFLDSTLHKVLPDLMCPAIDAVLVYVNKKWASLNAPMPVGQVGTVQYVLTSVPTTTASYIQVDFSPVVQKQKGNTIQLEDAGGAAFPEDYAEGSSQLLLSAAFLTAELALLQKSFDVKVKDTMIGELPPQTTVTLAGFIPKVAEAYPKSKPLVTKIRINKSPKVTMKTGKSLLHLHGTLEMFAARRRGKPPVSLFVLETRFNLKIQYSVHEDRLQMTTSLDRLLSMSRRSSSIGPFKEKKLTGFITDFLQEAYIPVINGVMPTMLGVWSLLLLWALVTPCQGLLETVGTLARIDKDELGKAIQNSLVGGPILQNVLGTVTSVNQGLLGSGGLLGGGGLLGYGGVFGVVEELSGLKVEEVTLPKVSVKLLPGFGVQLNLHTKVGLHGSSPLGGLLQLAAEVNVSSRVALGVSARGTPILILKRCSTLLGHISLLTGLLPAPLFGVVEQTLFKVLPELLCPVVDSVLGVVNELLGAVLGLVPLGALGSVEFTLATLPLISNQYIELDVNPIVKSVAGDIVDFPKPRNPIKVPPKEDHTSQVTVPLFLFNTMFGLLQTSGALDLDITPELALRKLPPGQQLLLSLRVKKAPTVTLQNHKATVSIPTTIHVLSYLPKGAHEALFQLNGVMTLNAQLAPSATKLHISLSLERLSVKLASSSAHTFDASRLEEWLSNVVRLAYVPKVNVNLDVGIPLPKILNVNFASAALAIIEVSFPWWGE